MYIFSLLKTLCAVDIMSDVLRFARVQMDELPHISNHARLRMLERGWTLDEVLQGIESGDARIKVRVTVKTVLPKQARKHAKATKTTKKKAEGQQQAKEHAKATKPTEKKSKWAKARRKQRRQEIIGTIKKKAEGQTPNSFFDALESQANKVAEQEVSFEEWCEQFFVARR